ncbi:MAG: hypothetical protein ACJ8F3_08640 [Xanthobacteraceae bacterium]
MTTNLSRRAVVAGAAAAAVPSGGTAIANAPDPAFAAIDAWKAANRLLDKAYRAQSHLEESLPDHQRTWRPNYGDGKGPPEGCADDPEWIAAELARAASTDRHHDALITLLTTEPTTFAGLQALLAAVGSPKWDESGPYVEEIETIDEPAPLLFYAIGYSNKEIVKAALCFPQLMARATSTIAARADAPAHE